MSEPLTIYSVDAQKIPDGYTGLVIEATAIDLDQKYQRRVCANPIRHAPAPMNLQKHHIQPLSWGGPDVPDNWVMICPTCHEGAHTALNMIVDYERALRPVPAEVWQRFHPFFRMLAEDAVRRAGGIKRIYTTAQPGEK